MRVLIQIRQLKLKKTQSRLSLSQKTGIYLRVMITLTTMTIQKMTRIITTSKRMLGQTKAQMTSPMTSKLALKRLT